MRRFAAILALATLLACASADHHSGGPKTHDVTPTPESTNIWGLMPYDDLEVTVGTTIIFRSPQGFHDIALVPTRSEMDSCDVSNATVVMDQGGVIQPDFVGNSTSVTEEGFFYVLSWTPTVCAPHVSPSFLAACVCTDFSDPFCGYVYTGNR